MSAHFPGREWPGFSDTSVRRLSFPPCRSLQIARFEIRNFRKVAATVATAPFAAQ
jgi:hypothetical protein